MSVRSSRRWAALPAAALLALAVTSCSGDDAEPEDAAESTAAPATPAAVPLEAEGLPEGASIGVVVSLSSPDDSGSQ